jgi:DNA-binding CsgD family transcriptional regulator/PAS domain-containing protein
VDRALNEVLTTLYSAPLAPELWSSALSRLAALLQINASAIVRTDLSWKDNGVYISQGIDPEVERLYATSYADHDVYRARFLTMQRRIGELIMGDEMCTHQEMKNTAFYNDILRKGDIRLWCSVASVHSDTIIENITFYHSWNDEPPGPDQLAMAKLITPHIGNVLQLRAKLSCLEGLSRDLYSALDQADNGIVLFDHGGHCAFVNRTARRILDQRDGLLFSNNSLVATETQERSRLAELVRRAVSGCQPKRDPGGGIMRITRRRGRPLHLRVATFPCERLTAGSQFAAIGLIGDPDRLQHFPLEIIQSSYGLTPAEARLALLLLEGKSLAEAAELNHVTQNTLRSQLKSIFAKTGTRRQGELIGLLVALPGNICERASHGL